MKTLWLLSLESQFHHSSLGHSPILHNLRLIQRSVPPYHSRQRTHHFFRIFRLASFPRSSHRMLAHIINHIVADQHLMIGNRGLDSMGLSSMDLDIRESWLDSTQYTFVPHIK